LTAVFVDRSGKAIAYLRQVDKAPSLSISLQKGSIELSLDPESLKKDSGIRTIAERILPYIKLAPWERESVASMVIKGIEAALNGPTSTKGVAPNASGVNGLAPRSRSAPLFRASDALAATAIVAGSIGAWLLIAGLPAVKLAGSVILGAGAAAGLGAYFLKAARRSWQRTVLPFLVAAAGSFILFQKISEGNPNRVGRNSSRTSDPMPHPTKEQIGAMRCEALRQAYDRVKSKLAKLPKGSLLFLAGWAAFPLYTGFLSNVLSPAGAAIVSPISFLLGLQLMKETDRPGRITTAQVLKAAIAVPLYLGGFIGTVSSFFKEAVVVAPALILGIIIAHGKFGRLVNLVAAPLKRWAADIRDSRLYKSVAAIQWGPIGAVVSRVVLIGAVAYTGILMTLWMPMHILGLTFAASTLLMYGFKNLPILARLAAFVSLSALIGSAYLFFGGFLDAPRVLEPMAAFQQAASLVHLSGTASAALIPLPALDPSGSTSTSLAGLPLLVLLSKVARLEWAKLPLIFSFAAAAVTVVSIAYGYMLGTATGEFLRLAAQWMVGR